VVAKKDKYAWLEGAPPPPLEEHSIVKHSIISEYIHRYICTLLAGFVWDNLKISIVDGFAGGGKYTNILNDSIENGSPFLILNSVQEAQAYLETKFERSKEVQAEYYFVEKNTEYFQFLSSEIAKSQHREKLNKNLFLYNSSFHAVADKIIKRISERNKAQRCLFVLDQFAYKDVPFQYIKKAMTQLKNSEVLLTFGFESLQSFLSDNKKSRSAMKRIGLEPYIDWNRLEELKRNGFWHHLIQEQLSLAIKAASGANHMTLFFIEPKKGWSYWLVHLSKQYKARSVMMDIHWDSANKVNGQFSHVIGDGLFGLGFKASKVPKQATFEFDDVMEFDKDGQLRCVNALTKDLSRFIYNNQPLTYQSLLAKIGDLTAATEGSIKEALQNLMNFKEVKIINSETKVPRRTAKQVKANDILSYQQQSLFSVDDLTIMRS